MTFTGDIAPAARVRDLPTDTMDLADLWEATPTDQDWHDYIEATYDPDFPFPK